MTQYAVRSTQYEQGIALILVISVLAIVSIMAISFAFTMQLEAKMAANFQESTRADYIAEAGVAHAREVLRQDKAVSRIDHEGEGWRTVFAGADVDNDGDGTPDSAWIPFTDLSGNEIGRYAVLVVDELSKININSAGFFPDDPFAEQEGTTSFEMSLEEFFKAEGIEEALELARNIVDVRYGGERGHADERAGHDDDGDGLMDEAGFPGLDRSDLVDSYDENRNNVLLTNDGLDNNANGVRDELGEGINEPDEFQPAAPFMDDRPFISPEELKKVKGLKTVFDALGRKVSTLSAGDGVDVYGARRMSLNTASVSEIYGALAARGIDDAGRLAVNIADYRDTDQARTTLMVEGPSGLMTYHGVESVRFNEIMIEPLFNLKTQDEGPKKDWQWMQGHYRNGYPGRGVLGEGMWEWTGIPPGFYLFTFYANAAGETIGDVRANGFAADGVKHGNALDLAVEVKSDGLVTIRIQNNREEGSTYFQSVKISQEPDAEYVELVNLSRNAVSLSGWTLEYAPYTDEGWRANLPDVSLEGHGYLVLAVDADDTDAEPFLANANDVLKGNKISVRGSWPALEAARVGELKFEVGTSISPGGDVIRNAPEGRRPLTLRDGQGRIVEEVEYDPGAVREYVSLEKGDPAYGDDEDANGVDDFWYDSLGDLVRPKGLGTPGAENKNDGIIRHILDERLVKDRPFGSIGELGSLSSRGPWSLVSSGAIALIADRVTAHALRLEAEGHVEEPGGFSEVLRSVPLTAWYESHTQGDILTGVWGKSDCIQDGTYTLRVWGYDGEAVAISVFAGSGEGGPVWSEFTPSLTFQNGDVVTYGLVEITDGELKVQIRNDSVTGTSHVDYVTLEPAASRLGTINLNTASWQVLAALPGVDETIAQALAAERGSAGPFGERNAVDIGGTRIIRGVGDAALSDALISDLEPEAPAEEKEAVRLKRFSLFSNFIDVKSDWFEIISTAQTLKGGNVLAESKVRSVVER
ncbi:MAG: general secretion pathway protein GspK [Candidatus Omnitrophica bacterium]|nr:general secretion pathway protein GspK [Candidatus Omnitrophota bacterium]